MIRKTAYAKVNLFLNVDGKRQDGYHDMTMINAHISLADEIYVETATGSTAITILSDDKFLETNDNLIRQTAKMMIDLFRPDAKIRIGIKKRIPAGAGLAGNSADAAMVIEGLNELWSLHLDKPTMQKIALPLGADIPFCFETAICLVQGIGELIEPLPVSFKGYCALIVKPPVYVGTKLVFEAGDQFGYRNVSADLAIKAAKNADVAGLISLVHNSFEPITFSLHPDIQSAYERIAKVFGPTGLFMTGTGSTLVKIIPASQRNLDLNLLGFRGNYVLGVYDFL